VSWAINVSSRIRTTSSLVIFDIQTGQVVGNHVYDVKTEPKTGQVRFESYSAEYIDTGQYQHGAGRMMMQMRGSFAEFERAMLRERTKQGWARAKAAGRKRDCYPRFLKHPLVASLHYLEESLCPA
jgi:hypothetical protein